MTCFDEHLKAGDSKDGAADSPDQLDLNEDRK
jgi:hypothetical protein